MKTIQTFLESPEVRGLAKSTRDLYGYALGHVEKFWISLVPRFYEDEKEHWLSININTFATYLENQNLSGKSIQQYLTITKIFLKWAGHPTEFTYKISNKLRQENKLKHLSRWFSERDIAKCLAYRFPNGEGLTYKACVRLLTETGARVGEISTITPEDVHLEDHYLFVHGKTEPRPVIFSDQTAVLLGQLLDQVPQDMFDKAKEYRLFPETARLKAAITQMLKDLGLKNGKDGRGAHTFRHWACTHMVYDGGMDLTDVAYLMGDKVETIRNHYLHPTPEMLRKRVDRAMGWGR